MGIDFDINVNLKTIGKSDVESAEKSLEKILSYNGKTVALNLKFNDGNGADFTKYFSNLEKQAQSAGKSVGNSFQQGFKAVKFNGNSEEFLKQFIAQENKVREEAKTTAQKYNTSNSIALKAVNARNKAQIKAEQEQIKQQKKAQTELDNIENARLKSIENSRKREEKLIQDQNKAINKAQEQKYKQEQKDLDAMENARLKSIENAKKREEQATLAQNKAINKSLEDSYKKQQQEQQKSNAQNLAQIRTAEAAQKHIQVQQQIAAMKANSTNKNAHYDELVQQGKDNIAKWKKDYQKQAEEVVKIQENVLNGTYSAKNSNFNSKLSSYKNQNSELLNEARNQAKAYNDELTKLQKHFDSNDLFKMNDDEVVKSFNNMDNAAKKFENIMNEVKNTTSKDLGLGVAERSANEVRAYYESNTKALKKYGAELKDLEQRYKGVKTVAEKSELDNQFKNLKSTISAEGLTGKSWSSELSRSVRQIAEFAGVYNIVRNVAFQIPSQMVEAVKDVNKAQIELVKVSDASSNQLSQYWDEAASSAQKYGATISDVISSTADWSRLGYNLDEAKKLSDATTLLQKVGDNMTQETASQGLISTLRGFNMQADEVNKIVDVANQIANTQPIDTAGIFEGLENSASSMSAANNTLEQTISLLTAANSVIQDPSSVGNALKTISMRVRGASTELEQAGLDADGMAESVAKLREEIKALSGVDIMQDENTFKSTYDILDELSTKWKDLTDIQRASVTELIAGKRNGNTVSALMQNFDIARETLKTALNDSEGSAEKELANYQKGIEYSLDKLQAAFQKFSTTAVNSDFLKAIVDAGTEALNVLSQLIDKIGVLATLGAGAGIIALVKNFGSSNEFALYGCKPIAA